MTADTRHRVVVVGAGFGGLFATRFLRRADVEVTLLDRHNHHLFQPLLYQVATGILSSGQIAPSIRDVLHRQRNVTVELVDVDDFDLDRRSVSASLLGGRRVKIPYDSLIVAAGAGQSYFGHDEFARYAPGLKTIDDALEIRGRIYGAFELAELEDDPQARREWLTFVVVGGGATGVEMAGQIAILSRRTLREDFRRIDSADARVLLYDGGEQILASFGNRLSGKGARELERLGVEIHTETIVTDVGARSVEIKRADGSVERVPARTKIWAAGVRGSRLGERLAAASGVSLDANGRVEVAPDCSVPGYPEVFVVGDLMALDDFPGVAEVAMQSGIHAANTIKRRLAGKEPADFNYRDLGSMAALSRFRAIVSFRGIRLAGFTGWLVWLVVHITFLTGFKNRFTTLFHWTVTLVARGRTERTITRHQVAARLAIEQAGGEDELMRSIQGGSAED
ncbi:MAG: NAD(P)/FAD-dependent oxidoreductase [Solirubrobacterales bacterium]